MAITKRIARRHKAAPEQERPQESAVDWGELIHRASQVIAILALIATVLLIARYVALHRGFDPATTDDELVAILLGLVVFLLAATVAVLRPERIEIHPMLQTSAVWSLVTLLALVVVWTLIDVSVRDRVAIGTSLTSQAAVDAFLEQHLPAAAADGAPVVRIPTGVQVQSVAFTNANNVQVSGFIWQKYGPAVPADIKQGVVLPDAVVEAYQAAEAYRFTTADGTTVVGWYFQATLRQAFDYRRYPFDRQDVLLRLWHQDFDRRVVLVPDFASYRDLEPRSTPGLSPRLVHTGWIPEHSGFSYDLSNENTTFGYDSGPVTSEYPEFFFNIGLKREFLNPFFDYINFSIVVFLLLFAVVCLTAREEETKSRFGISTFGVLGSAGTLLFAVLLKHSQLRTAIAADQIAYLEVLPSLLYLGILLASLNAILLALPLRLGWLEYRNNILPDLLYWPLLLGLLFSVTVLVFY